MADLRSSSTSKEPDSRDAEMEQEVLPGYRSISDFTKDGYKTLMEAIRHSNSLPQDDDWHFHKVNPDFMRLVNNEGNTVLRLINRIIKDQCVQGSITSRDLEEKIELIVETNDFILERVADNLDEVNGIRKNPEMPLEIQTVSAKLPVNGSWNRFDKSSITVTASAPSVQQPAASHSAIRLLTAKNIMRPQQFFKDTIDNSNEFPWQPRITDKPNWLKPLAIYLEECEDGLAQTSFCHPYEFELDCFEPRAEQLTPVQAVLPRPVSETPLVMVNREEQLGPLLEDLRRQTEIAVDLEHHSYRSFMGITCLMQISTADTDYVVDTLSLRDKLAVLNEVFTKPSVVKVFHGADQDVLWLQRDLSLYVVNMFDTHQAARQLELPQLSLAFLLKKFCGVDANKHFQLADWRIRPLPPQLVAYAREDTHYLLYIYHALRNALLQQPGGRGAGPLRAVLQRSTAVCKRRYVKPVRTADSHLDLYRRCKKMFDNRQMTALRSLYAWRDELARTEDESTGYVLPNHMLLQVAEVLPREMQGVLACCNPIPPLVRAHLLDIHKLVLRARDQPLERPILSEGARARGSTQRPAKLNVDCTLNCPHDLPRAEDLRDDLPTLLGTPGVTPNCTAACLLPLEAERPRLDVFHAPAGTARHSRLRRLRFLGPFERYKLVKPFIQAEENKERSLDDGDDDRPLQDRINSLQTHFNSLAASIPQLLADKDEQPEPTTIGTAHSKKRKRSEVDVDVPEDKPTDEEPLSKVRRTDQPEHPELSKATKKKIKKKSFKKQKQEELNRQKRHQWQQHNQHWQAEHRPDVRPDVPFHGPGQARYFNKMQLPKPCKKVQPHARKQKQQHTEQHPRSKFDYGSVNYNEFQGGAGSVSHTNVKSNFKGKGKNKKRFSQGKNQSKSGMFEGPKMPGAKGSR